MSSNDQGLGGSGAPGVAAGDGDQGVAGGSNPTSQLGPAEIAGIRATWSVTQPGRAQYSEVSRALRELCDEGEGSIFQRGPHVPPGHCGYFRPPNDAFTQSLHKKDARSGKEWVYINAAGVWADIAATALNLAKTETGTMEQFVGRLSYAMKALAGCREVLAMPADYFKDIVEMGYATARSYAAMAEQSADITFSETHRSIRDAVANRIELEAAKQLAKLFVEGSAGGSRKRKGDSPSE